MKTYKELPLIPLRGLTLFPYMVLHFDVGRDKSIKALDAAMMENQEIFLVTQKDARQEDPADGDIFEMGTICTIRQLLKLPGNTVRVLVEGAKRGKLVSTLTSEPYHRVKLEVVETEADIDETEKEALVRSVKEAFDDFVQMSGSMPPEALITVEDMVDSDRFSDMVASYMNLKTEEKQELLEAVSLKKRLEKLLVLIKNELEILKIERKIGSKVKSNIDKSQRDYYLREQIRANLLPTRATLVTS